MPEPTYTVAEVAAWIEGHATVDGDGVPVVSPRNATLHWLVSYLRDGEDGIEAVRLRGGLPHA